MQNRPTQQTIGSQSLRKGAIAATFDVQEVDYGTFCWKLRAAYVIERNLISDLFIGIAHCDITLFTQYFMRYGSIRVRPCRFGRHALRLWLARPRARSGRSEPVSGMNSKLVLRAEFSHMFSHFAATTRSVHTCRSMSTLPPHEKLFSQPVDKAGTPKSGPYQPATPDGRRRVGHLIRLPPGRAAAVLVGTLANSSKLHDLVRPRCRACLTAQQSRW